jgi:hypothetical protein
MAFDRVDSDADYETWLAMGKEMLAKWKGKREALAAELSDVRARATAILGELEKLDAAIGRAATTERPTPPAAAGRKPEGWKRVAMERNRRVIAAANGQLSIGQIAAAIGCDPKDATQALIRGAEKGLLIRVREGMYAPALRSSNGHR